MIKEWGRDSPVRSQVLKMYKDVEIGSEYGTMRQRGGGEGRKKKKITPRAFKIGEELDTQSLTYLFVCVDSGCVEVENIRVSVSPERGRR
jgi:hypothetical protein